MKILKIKFIFPLTSLLIIFSFSRSSAMRISKIKDSKVLVELEGESTQIGTEYFAVDKAGKKRALVKIKVIKGDRAIGDVTKGTASNGQILRARSPQIIEDSQTTAAIRNSRERWGIIGGYSLMDAMSLTGQNGAVTDNLKLKGSTFQIKGFYDYPWKPRFTLRGISGLDGFTVTGSPTPGKEAVCNGNTTCSANFQYLSFEGHLLWNFPIKKYNAWLGGGYVLYYTMSGSTNIANLDATVKTNSMFSLSGGFDYPMDRNSFMPIGIQYGYFPLSGLQASRIAIFAGWGTKF